MKFITTSIVFLLLGILGGVASPTFYRGFVEQDLAMESSELIQQAGLKNVAINYEFLHAKVTGTVDDEQEKNLLLQALDSKITGAYFDGSQLETEIAPGAEVFAILGKDQVIDLGGFVADQDSKIMFGVAASSVPGVLRVENRLQVVRRVEPPQWRKTAPRFLFEFFSASGTRKIHLDSRGVLLEGEVNSLEIREGLGKKALAILAAPQIVQNLLSVTRLEAPRILILGTPDGVKVSGRLPDDESRNLLITTVKRANPGRLLTDECEIDRGVAEPLWLTNARNLIPLFFQETAGTGSIEYSGDRLVLKGKVSNEASVSALATLASAAIPKGFSTEILLGVQPRTDAEILLTREENGRIILSGTVPDMATRDEIVNGLKLNFPDAIIHDLIKVSANVRKATWQSPGSFFCHLLQQSPAGSVELHMDQLIFRGEVDSAETRSNLYTEAQTVIGEKGTVLNFLFVKPRQGESGTFAKLKQGLKSRTIFFDSGSSGFKDAEDIKLRESAQLIAEAGSDFTIIMGAYHDPSGDPTSNKRLSLKRANSVRDRLIDLGVPDDQLRVQYFGSDDTYKEENELWKSRRVELTIETEAKID